MQLLQLTKRELEIINRKNFAYPLAIAEKDYFLTVVSKIIYDSPLRKKLIFKGGTALHHCYLPQLRFSEDLDFTAIDKSITIEAVKEIFEQCDFLSIKKEYVSPATIKIEKLQYRGLLGLPGSLKLEIDHLQNAVLPAKALVYKNVWKVPTKVRVMDEREICAEKIRAASDRARYRDFYDLAMLFRNYKFDLKEIAELIRQKEICQPITKKSILSNWRFVQKDREQEERIVYYAEAVTEQEIKKVLAKLPFEIIK